MEQGTGACVCFEVDSRASQFNVQAFASGLISGVAHSPKIAIRDWSGEAKFVPGSLKDASLKVRIKTASLEVLDQMRDSDRREIHRVMKEEVLNMARFPEVSFESYEIAPEKQTENVYRVRLAGRLSLHGVTGSQTLSAHVAFGVDSLRAHGEFIVLQTDYDIPVASIAGGTLRLRDDLKFTFYVVARKRNSA
jgi:polyisoprenoid-binding protein YceI